VPGSKDRAWRKILPGHERKLEEFSGYQTSVPANIDYFPNLAEILQVNPLDRAADKLGENLGAENKCP